MLITTNYARVALPETLPFPPPAIYTPLPGVAQGVPHCIHYDSIFFDLPLTENLLA